MRIIHNSRRYSRRINPLVLILALTAPLPYSNTERPNSYPNSHTQKHSYLPLIVPTLTA